MKRAVLVAALLGSAGCPGHGGGAKFPQPSTAVTAQDVIARLAAQRAARTTFSGESVMDYWLGDQRVKGTVLVMGTSQRQVRFNALSPQGGGVLADMACDGTNYTYVDFQNNCQLAGPCNSESINALLRVHLEPDDFASLAVGVPPIGPNATGTVTWDARKGEWVAALQVPGGAETIRIDARDGRFDVVAAKLVGPAAWSVENSDFEQVANEGGDAQRLPQKTHFKSPGEQADLLVEWQQRKLNTAIGPEKFKLEAPSGLPACH